MLTRNSVKPTSYAEANAMLGGRYSLPVMTATTLERFVDGLIGVRYHWTSVVEFSPDGSIVLNSGGFSTVTTLRRMNQFTPANIRVVQRDFEWYVIRGNDEPIPFADGMRLPGDWLAEVAA